MPEVFVPNRQHCSTSTKSSRASQCLSTSSVSTSTRTVPANWLYLPYEIWLMILVDYDITSRDLVNLDRTCKWFKFSWGGKNHAASVTYIMRTGKLAIM